MNTFMHGPSFLSFLVLSFSISFPKLTIFTILRLYMACKVWKITAHFRDIELKTGRKIPYLRFPHVLFSIQSDWRAWNYKTKKKNIWLEYRNLHKKTWMKWNDYFIFSSMRMRKRHLFCTCSHHSAPYEKQHEVWALKWLSLLERVRNC